jgi:hypothetical protein
MSRYKVRAGTRVIVGGRPYSNGATFEATADQVPEILMAGYIEPVKVSASRRKP